MGFTLLIALERSQRRTTQKEAQEANLELFEYRFAVAVGPLEAKQRVGVGRRPPERVQLARRGSGREQGPDKRAKPSGEIGETKKMRVFFGGG